MKLLQHSIMTTKRSLAFVLPNMRTSLVMGMFVSPKILDVSMMWLSLNHISKTSQTTTAKPF